MADKPLTVKEERFVQGLFAGLTQREAYKQAYNCAKMKDTTIDVKACELAKKDKIAVRLKELQDEFKERNMITVERVLQEYAKLGFHDPRKFFNKDGSPKDIMDLDDDTAATLAGFEVMEIWEGKGKNKQFVGYLKKYKLADKKGTLDSIGKHLGMFVDRHEIDTNITIDIVPAPKPDGVD